MDIVSYLMGQAAGGGIDTSDATATADKIVKDYTAYVNGEKVTGTLQAVSSYVTSMSSTGSFTIRNVMFPNAFQPKTVFFYNITFGSFKDSANYICSVYGTDIGTANEKYYVVTTDGTLTSNITGLMEFSGSIRINDPADHGMTGVSYAGGWWVVALISDTIS